jgi:hypothetical protein
MSNSLVRTRLTLVRRQSSQLPRLLSWRTSRDDDDEAVIIRSLGGLYSNQIPNSDPMREAHALMFDWYVYSGAQYAPSVSMQLQVSGIPTSTPPRRRMDSDGLKLPSMRYRIPCLSPGTSITVQERSCQTSFITSKTDDIPTTGLLDLSTDSAERLSEFWCSSGHHGRADTYPRFEGTRTNLNSCLEMLVKEIWANEGGGLTAWQQLYMLACLKRWFGKYWEIDDSLPKTSAREEGVDVVISEEDYDSEDDVISQEASN